MLPEQPLAHLYYTQFSKGDYFKINMFIVHPHKVQCFITGGFINTKRMIFLHKLGTSNFSSWIIGSTACTNQHGLPEIQGTMSCIRIQISSVEERGNSAIVTFQPENIYSEHVWPLSAPGSDHRGEMGGHVSSLPVYTSPAGLASN